METKCKHIFAVAFIGFLSILQQSNAVPQFTCRTLATPINDTCGHDYFKCFTGPCLERSRYCDGNRDCPDSSDERHCKNTYGCPDLPSSNPKYYECSHTEPPIKCILEKWKCDGVIDCPSGDDENNCDETYIETFSVNKARKLALEWLHKKYRSDSLTAKWGPLVHKAAIALYLSDPDFSKKDSITRQEMAYEMSIQILSRKKLGDLSSTDLASFINGLLVTCLDPRQFYGIDLVNELRERISSQNYTHPYVLLTLCNAGDTMTEADVTKIVDTFWIRHREFWTETEALVVMALTCAKNQEGNIVDSELLRALTTKLKQNQYRNGTVETVQTTALVLQALYSADHIADPDDFDEQKALHQILVSQKLDGSFGSFMKTYYVLPVFSCNSLVHISSSHCKTIGKSKVDVRHGLMNLQGPSIRVHFSLWFGDQRYMERNLTLRVPKNSSFYSIMEKAGDIDSRYRFEHLMKDGTPYVNAVSEVLDDPEGGNFWYFYKIQDGKPVFIQTSPVDVKPIDNEHFVMWYRSGFSIK